MGKTCGEVAQVERHRRALRGAVEAQSRNGEVLVRHHMVGEVAQRVALAAQRQGVERIRHRHVGVERIVARHNHFFRVGVVDRCSQLHLGRQEFTGIEIRRHGVLIQVVVSALTHGFFEAAETVCFRMSRHIDIGQVCQLDIELALCCPTAFVGKVLQAQFVCPHLDAAHTARVIAQTDHHRAHFAQRGITLHADFVLRALWVVFVVDRVVRSQARSTLTVARFLHVRELLEIDVDHIICRPHRTASRATGVATFRRKHQRNFVFVEIVFVVRSESEEQTHLSVCQILVTRQRIGVHKELEVLVATKVEMRVLIHGTRIATAQFFHGERERLLVVLQHLVLSRLNRAANARGQDIVHRLFVVVLFEVHGAHHELSRRSRRHVLIKRLTIVTPLTAYEAQRGKTQHNRLIEARHEHTHEANRRKVADTTVFAFVFAQRNAEQIPFRGGRLAVARFRVDGAHVDNVVLSDLHRRWIDAHAVLIVFFVLVEGEILVDIFHIRRRLVSRSIRFAVSRRRVTVRIVDIFVAFEDRSATLVPMLAAEIGVLVGRGALYNRIVYRRSHRRTDCFEIVGISAESALLFRGQTVVTHVLSAACIARRVEGISHRILRRHQTPRRFRHLRAVAVCRESTFVELTAVFEHIFRYFAQIEVEIAVVSRHFSVDLREGIHHPKLHILHIGRIEVRSLETAHHTAPALRRIQQSAVAVQRRIEVVRAAFVGVEGQIEHR